MAESGAYAWVRGVRLGIDVGSVRVGVAISDPDGILATPLMTLARDNRTGPGSTPGDPQNRTLQNRTKGAPTRKEADAIPGAPGVPREMAEIARLVAEHSSVEVVVGLPVNLAGIEGPAAKKIREYARILGEVIAPVPIVMADERMSTVTAARRLSDRGVKGKRQRAVVDQAAAVEILQHYLESRRRQR
jgi:putative Holliday junction resolvase